MKKSITIFLCLSLVFSVSLTISAQSTGMDLDQVELMKQFSGTWKTEGGEDTTFIWEIIPFGKGYEAIGNWKAKGETYSTIKSVFGFANEMKKVNMFHLDQGGDITRALGEFVSEIKIVMEFLNFDHSRILAKWESSFSTPDIFKITYNWKGGAETWVDANVTEYNFIRVK